MTARTQGAPATSPRQRMMAAMWRARAQMVPYVVADEPDPAILEFVRGIDEDLIEIARAVEEFAPRQSARRWEVPRRERREERHGATLPRSTVYRQRKAR